MCEDTYPDPWPHVDCTNERAGSLIDILKNAEQRLRIIIEITTHSSTVVKQMTTTYQPVSCLMQISPNEQINYNYKMKSISGALIKPCSGAWLAVALPGEGGTVGGMTFSHCSPVQVNLAPKAHLHKLHMKSLPRLNVCVSLTGGLRHENKQWQSF